MTHTPGSWTLNKMRHAALEIMGVGWMGNRRIAKVLYCGGSEDPEVHANAVLIAAAPDMLKVLEWITNVCCGVSKGGGKPSDAEMADCLENAKQAIAKAKGE